MELHWLILAALLCLLAMQVINAIMRDNLTSPYVESLFSSKEGFENMEANSKAQDESTGQVKYLNNSELYDEFYASIYDQLTQGTFRTQAEVALMFHEWTKRGEDKETFSVLDAGCGTGIAVASFAKLGVKKVVGLDNSEAMLKQAKEHTMPATTLTDVKKAAIEWRKQDLLSPGACEGGEFTHACLLYFTVYYFIDKETLFRNLFFWVKPGGKLVVHVVNKHKFDPILDSAAGWVGFSLQKYADKRINRSDVTFNKMKYSGEFDLQDPRAEFRETFRFQDGKVRRQKHETKMESMDEIVGMAKVSGWDYVGYTDLTQVGFEYAYHLHFKHP
jgi:SAM-dependent methyltransferase